MNKYSFQPGWDQVKRKYGSEIRAEAKAQIMSAFQINSYDAWIRRKRGVTDPTVDEKTHIDNVFRSYGIKTGIWGYETDEYRAAHTAGA